MIKIGTYTTLYLLAEGVPHAVAFGRSCSIKTNTKFMSVASRNNGIFVDYIPGQQSFSITSRSILSNDECMLWNMFRSNSPVKFIYGNTDGCKGYCFCGEAVITQLKFEGNMDNMAMFSIELTGTGAIDYKLYKIDLLLTYWIKGGTLKANLSGAMDKASAVATFQSGKTLSIPAAQTTFSVSGYDNHDTISSISISGHNAENYTITATCKTENERLQYTNHHGKVYAFELLSEHDNLVSTYADVTHDGATERIHLYRDYSADANPLVYVTTTNGSITKVAIANNGQYVNTDVSYVSKRTIYYQSTATSLQFMQSVASNTDISIPSLGITIPAGEKYSNTVAADHVLTTDEAYALTFRHQLNQIIFVKPQDDIYLYAGQNDRQITVTLSKAMTVSCSVIIKGTLSSKTLDYYMAAGDTTFTFTMPDSYGDLEAVSCDYSGARYHVMPVVSNPTVALICMIQNGGSSGNYIQWKISGDKANNASPIVINYDETYNNVRTHHTVTIDTDSYISNGYYSNISATSQISNVVITDNDARQFTWS